MSNVLNPRRWQRIGAHRYRVMPRVGETHLERPNLPPISASVTELDARYPHLAEVNRKNWKLLGYRPTMTMQEFERQKGGGA